MAFDDKNSVTKDKNKLFPNKKDFLHKYYSFNRFPTKYASEMSYCYQLKGLGSIYTPHHTIFSLIANKSNLEETLHLWKWYMCKVGVELMS